MEIDKRKLQKKLARGRTSFHLSTLEATYIKTSKPNLCKQKEFVYGLKITHLFPLLPLIASFTNHDIAFFPFFLFRQLCLYISDSLHLFTLFLTNSLEKCQGKALRLNTLLFACYFDTLMRAMLMSRKRSVLAQNVQYTCILSVDFCFT